MAVATTFFIELATAHVEHIAALIIGGLLAAPFARIYHALRAAPRSHGRRWRVGQRARAVPTCQIIRIIRGSRVQPFRLPGRAARQLPDQSTTLWVESLPPLMIRAFGAHCQLQTFGNAATEVVPSSRHEAGELFRTEA